MAWLRDAVDAQPRVALLMQQAAGSTKSPGSGGVGAAAATASSIAPPQLAVPRVFGTDAILQDADTMDLFSQQFRRATGVGRAAQLATEYADECALALSAVVYKLTFWDRGQSIGDRLQNVVLCSEAAARAAPGATNAMLAVATPSNAPSRVLRLLHAALTLLLPYVVTKLERRALEEGWAMHEPASVKYRAAKALKYATIAVKLLTLLNTLAFLRGSSVHRTLTEKLLQLRLAAGHQRTRRIVNLELMNQHVSWSQWTTFLNVFLPLLNLGRVWHHARALGAAFARGNAEAAGGDGGPSGSPGLPPGRCVACRELATLPRTTNCGHTYCYYCLTVRTRDDGGDSVPFKCVRCGANVHASI